MNSNTKEETFLYELKQTAYKLQNLMRNIPEEDKEALKTKGFLKTQRRRVIDSCWVTIFACNQYLATVYPEDYKKLFEKEE